MWILEILAYVAVASGLGYFIYVEFLSPSEKERRAELKATERRRFERREKERADRRQTDLGPPAGQDERRVGPRRGRERR